MTVGTVVGGGELGEGQRETYPVGPDGTEKRLPATLNFSSFDIHLALLSHTEETCRLASSLETEMIQQGRLTDQSRKCGYPD